MSEPLACPYCGAPQPPGRDEHPSAADAVTREVRRLREIAEARAADEQDALIERLSREITELRATVARLRATRPAGGTVPVPASREATAPRVASVT